MRLVKLLSILLYLIGIPLLAQATSGACSWHDGVNCGIGSVNNQAVCNDGWLSSVPYYNMEECIGYDSSCTTYLNGVEYNSTKTALKNELGVLEAEIDKLKSDLNSLDYEEQLAILELYESSKGRGITTGGLQPFINAINREYEQKEIEVSYKINFVTSQYNEKVKEYNGICLNYTDEQKNNVCVKNFGGQYKYISGLCIAPPPKALVCTSWVYSDWNSCTGNRQKRIIISSYPTNCTGGNPVVSQPCQEKLVSNNKDVVANSKKITKITIIDNNDNETKEFVDKERGYIKKIDNKLSSRLKGRILLQVEEHGEAWYIAPKTSKRHYMANGSEAYSIMRNLGVGITNKDLDRVMTDKSFAKQHSGKIFLQVEAHGEAYYIDVDGNAHYLKNGEEAYNIMRDLGLGITNNDLRKIDIN